MEIEINQAVLKTSLTKNEGTAFLVIFPSIPYHFQYYNYQKKKKCLKAMYNHFAGIEIDIKSYIFITIDLITTIIAWVSIILLTKINYVWLYLSIIAHTDSWNLLTQLWLIIVPLWNHFSCLVATKTIIHESNATFSFYHVKLFCVIVLLLLLIKRRGHIKLIRLIKQQ